VKTFIIAEAGSNHDMDLDKAVDLVKAAKRCGADAVKFQFWSSARRMARRRRAPEYEGVYAKYQIPEDWLGFLAGICQSIDIEFMCSSYLPEDVDLVAEHVKRFKVASFEANDPLHLTAHVPHLRRGKDVIVSCGLGADRAVIKYHLAGRADNNRAGRVHLLWCVSAYPAPIAELRLRRLGYKWDSMTNLPYVGFSDHSPPDSVISGAVAVGAGAVILERHMRVDTTDPENPDYPHASDPATFKAYVERVRQADLMMDGDEGHAGPIACEDEMRKYRVTEAD
jgi:sialic acid synthase SpsE